MTQQSPETILKTFTNEESMRLDRYLSQTLQYARNQITQMIKNQQVRVNSKISSKPGLKLKKGDTLEIILLTATPTVREAVDFEVPILYEDEDILVLNKPSGLTVHPAPSVKEATLVDWLQYKGISLSTISGAERHGIVHRLDKGTSGAIVIAKNNEAHEKLSQQLLDRTMGRYYLALIDLALKEHLIVDKPIARNPHNRLKMSVSNQNSAKQAKTAFFKLLSHQNGKELIACKLFSGRTHQIRVHLESLSRRIEGDPLYGFKSKKDTIDRIFLHAYILYLKHPKTGQMMEFQAPLPDNLKEYLGDLFDEKDYTHVLQADYIKSVFTSMDDWLYFSTKT